MRLGPGVGYDFDQRGMVYNNTLPNYGSARRRRAPTPPAVTNTVNEALASAKTARGGADLLHEALVNAEGPQDLHGSIVQEFRTNCRASLRVIDEQISWLTEEVHKASVMRSRESPLLLAGAMKELEGVQTSLLAVLRLYDGLERAGTDRMAQEQVKNDYTIRFLTSNNGGGTGEGSQILRRASSPSNQERLRRVSSIANTARGHADLLRDTVMFSSPEDLGGPLLEEFYKNCLDSQKAVFEHLQWADNEAAQSRRRATSPSPTSEETLLNELIATDQALTDALKNHDNMRREGLSTGKQRQKVGGPSANPRADLEAGFAAARGGKGNAELLLDALGHASREDLTGPLIQEFCNACRTSQKDILARIPLASATAEQSRGAASGSTSVREEEVLEELLGANEAIIKALEVYDAIESGKVPSHNERLGVPETGYSSKSLPATPDEVKLALQQQSLADLPPLTIQDKAKFTRIFHASQPANGVLTGGQAGNLLLKSKLPQEMLSRIWDLADVSRRGVLDLGDFTIAMYLVQACMSGSLKSLPPSLPAALYEQAGSKQLPNLLSHGPMPGSSLLNLPGPSATPQPAQPNRVGISDSHADRIFDTLDLGRTGRAQAYTVTSFILKLGLTMDAASEIMDLADTGRKGYLTSQEFATAMQIVDRKKAGQSAVLPSSTTLDNQSTVLAEDSGPSAASVPSLRIRQSTLIDMDTELDPTLVPLPRTPVSPGLPSPVTPPNRSQASSTHPLRPQATGSAFTPTTPSPRSSPAYSHQRTPSQQWDVSPAAKARFDTFFDTLDSGRKGYIEGSVAVPFFAQSKLPDAVMAAVWDLADANGDGRLTRDEFAVAMHLIGEKLKGKDLPRTVPPSLVPPASRRPPPLPPREASSSTSGTPPRPAQTHTSGAMAQAILAQSTGASSIAPPAFSERDETPPPSYEEVVGGAFR